MDQICQNHPLLLQVDNLGYLMLVVERLLICSRLRSYCIYTEYSIDTSVTRSQKCKVATFSLKKSRHFHAKVF